MNPCFYSLLLYGVLLFFQCIITVLILCILCLSVKSLEEDEWILDPAVIADTYGPEVLVCLMTKRYQKIRYLCIYHGILLVSILGFGTRRSWGQPHQGLPFCLAFFCFIIFLACEFTLLNLYQGLDFIVDGGVRVADPSTIVDMTGSSPLMVRQGKVIGLDCICEYCFVSLNS